MALPAIAHYEAQSLLRVVSATAPMDVVYARAARLVAGARFVPPVASHPPSGRTRGVMEESMVCLLPGAAEVYGTRLHGALEAHGFKVVATVNKALSPTYLALLAGHDPNSVTSTAAHSSPSAAGGSTDADADAGNPPLIVPRLILRFE